MTRLVLPTLLTAIGIAILCTLGFWQVQRLHWKNDILQNLDKAYAADSSELINFFGSSINPPLPDPYLYGRVSGTMDSEGFLMGSRTREGSVGYDVIRPLTTEQGAVLVNLGWVDLTGLKGLILNIPKGRTIWVEGLARHPPKRSFFSPKNSPANNIWLFEDIAQMAQARGLQNPLPYILYAEKVSVPLPHGLPNAQRWRPRNNHAQYALFWFAMAGALAVIYAIRFLLPARKGTR